MEKERDIIMKEIELDLEEKTIDGLVSYAMNNILKDRHALINWAVVDILKKVIETNGKCIEDKVKEKENGESNS